MVTHTSLSLLCLLLGRWVGVANMRAHRVHSACVPVRRRNLRVLVCAVGGLDNLFYAAPLAVAPVLNPRLSLRPVRQGARACLWQPRRGVAGRPPLHHRAARKRAGDTWSSYGARSEDEAYSYYVQGFRRDVGIAVAREFARYRYRLLRVPFIGVPREVVTCEGS